MNEDKWFNRDVISILDFTRDELLYLFDKTREMKNLLELNRKVKVLEGKIVSLAFFEPSTRTKLSFEVAAKRLGADIIGFSATEATSLAKGENFSDTIRMLDSYSDLIVVRHKLEGAAKFAAEIAESPVINGGDGRQHHPTQAMIDLYTVSELFGDIDNLVYGVLGDLRYGRAASSFILALTLFRPKKVYLISPPLLKIRPEIRAVIENSNINYEEVDDLNSVLHELDVLYVTRIQKERFPDPQEYEKVRGAYRVTLEVLTKSAKNELRILHPLPRVDEIDYRIDGTKWSSYFIQASNGVPLRMALLNLILGGEKNA